MKKALTAQAERWYLSRVNLFADLAPDELSVINAAAQPLRLLWGDAIFLKGEGIAPRVDLPQRHLRHVTAIWQHSADLRCERPQRLAKQHGLRARLGVRISSLEPLNSGASGDAPSERQGGSRRAALLSRQTTARQETRPPNDKVALGGRLS
ncbi:hypothetical protein HRbin17_02011 [bacterium HR17]|uniref:Uncharacterized protein n=1 Tax=Candidatus Fervidibacter japonicus TaxID=2035412 RepID=A0A2H5XE82_9BACT|nr:hypothetical protein HRbin17_02011 [bacterium HR17]